MTSLPAPRSGALALLLLVTIAGVGGAQTANRPPVAATTGPYVSASRNITLDGRPSSDPDRDALTYAWTFGDGTTGTGATNKHEYPKRGTFTVTLVVTDAKGAASAPATTTVTVHWPPDAEAGGPYTANEGSPLTLDGRASTDKDGDLPLSYAWTFGDGTTGTGAQPVKTYAQSGSYTAALIVTDARGAASSKNNATVTIRNVAPTVTATLGATSVASGTPVTLTGSFADPGTQDGPWPWTIVWGDGTPSTTGTAATLATPIAASHAFAAPGTYTVTLRVRDRDLEEGSAQRTITVTGGANRAPVAVVGGPYSGAEGATVQLNGAGSSDPDGDALTYAWEFGDGTTGTGAQPAHVYAQDGSYAVALTVTDANGAASTRVTGTVTIANVAPSVQASLGATTVAAGSPVTLAGSFADPGADGPWGYAIDWGDGTAPTTGSAAASGAPIGASHAYAAAGSYTVVLRVREAGEGGAEESVQRSLTVTGANAAPIAVAGGPYGGSEGGAIAFDGRGSSDPDGDALSYAWDFGDGTTGTGAQPTHVYAQDGTYTVRLSVTDARGGTSPAATATATVANVAPTVSASLSAASLPAGTSLALTGSVADPGAQDGPWGWTIDWGDGTTHVTGTLSSTAAAIASSHAYAAAGSYTVVVRARENGATPAEGIAQLTVTVSTAANAAPIAVIGGPYTGTEGAEVQLNGSGSSDPDGDALTYAWEFGDQTTGTGAQPAHAYAQNGTYTVALTVIDARGAASARVTGTVTITNVAPTVTASLSATSIPAGSSVTLTGSFTDPGVNDDPWPYEIVWGDGTANTTGSAASATTSISASHTYATAGSYTVVLRVRDRELAEGSAQRTLSVTPPPPVAQVVLIAGDIADCKRNTDEQTAAILERYPDATIFTAGDNAYPDATLQALNDCYGPTWGRFKNRTWPVIGNHEYSGSMPNGEGYHAYFGARAGELGKAYYTVTVGDWQVFVLNSEIPLKANTPQEVWLRSELAKSTKQCTMAIWHRPRFFSGTVNMEATTQKALWSALYAAGAEIIIGGHYHNYERFAPQDANGDADPARGIRQFIVGTGGKDFASFGTPAPNSEVRDRTAFGVLKLTLTSNAYSWEFLPAGTSTFTDSGAGTCR